MKKFMALFLTLVLTMVVFSACGKDKDATADVYENEGATTDEATSDSDDSQEADVVTTASIVTDADAFVKAVSADGTWIAAALNDITVEADLVVEGEFTNKDQIARKIALYTQDDEHNILEQFTLTAPKMIVKSENTKLQGGTFVGDIYVEANGFQLSKQATVEGNIYFATQEYMDSYTVDETSVVNGETSVATADEDSVDVVTTASIVTDADAFVKAVSADGTWIAAALNDITVEADLVVEGEFTNKDQIARKIALYTQDDEHNILEQFTLTAPKMIVKSENTKLQGGTFVGDIYVEANGFEVSKQATVEGNIYFASQEYMDSYVLDETAEVTGDVAVQ